MDAIKFISSGDSAIYCKLAESISQSVSDRIVSIHEALKERPLRGIIESVPSYTGLMIYFDPLIRSLSEIKSIVNGIYENVSALSKERCGRKINLPVCYGGAYGPDLEHVANISRITEEEVIEIHTSAQYLVYMLGFTPGFPYLGGMDQRISTPRKENPRIKIGAGSVGIAGIQTGIYPIDSPGGWQVIGKTPLQLFNFNKPEPFLFKTGDIVTFSPVSLAEYFQLSELIRNGEYKPEISIST